MRSRRRALGASERTADEVLELLGDARAGGGLLLIANEGEQEMLGRMCVAKEECVRLLKAEIVWQAKDEGREERG